MNYAPIALFTYSRADHTHCVVESLLANKESIESDLYVFSDGPKTESKREAVEENRRYIRTITGFKSVTIIERDRNWGLANSLIAGITEIVDKYGRVIVVEDDLILSPYFLKFMNDGLKKYENDDRVGAISGFVFPVEGQLPNTFFLRYFNCWGWATWKRSWALFNPDTKYLLRKMRFKVNEFDIGGIGAYGNLYCQKVGLVDSWWVRFYASLFLAGKLTLYPGVSLTTNEGMDGSGTHCRTDDSLDIILSKRAINIDCIEIQETMSVLEKYKDFFKPATIDVSVKGYYYRLKYFLRRVLYIDCL